MSLIGITRRLLDLAASSIVNYVPINTWLLDDRFEVSLPYVTKVKPDEKLLFKTKVSTPHEGNDWFLKLTLSGNALVSIDGSFKWGYDEAHTYNRFPPGGRVVEIRATPRGLFGQHQWVFEFRRALLINVSSRVFETALKALALIDYVSSLPKGNELRTSLEETLRKLIEPIRVTPSLKQITLLTILLYEKPSASMVKRRDLPGLIWDYSFLTDVYGVGVLENLIDEPTFHTTSLNQVEAVASRIESGLNEVLDDLKKRYGKKGVMHIAAHSHIDAAWLWPVGETVEKVLRTFSTIVSLMKEFDFAYIQSSAQYYEWVEEKDPDLFGEIKRLVNEGKWIIAGGMWVESDTNLLNGETLAKQFLYGQRFFLEKFGRLAKIGWLPDSFGYSGNLPQLIRKSGLGVFVIHKVMWNDTNEFPYSYFNWRGIDGSTIPVHVLISYDDALTLSSIRNYWEKLKDKDREAIYVFGYGDGGGGPTREMLIYLKTLDKTPETPTVKRLNEEEYLDYIEKIKDNLPEWVGEIYVETHRGTYTTNLQVKEAIAQAERKLVEAEAASTLVEIKTGERIVGNELRSLWKKLLLNTFHDILPGSSIREVYVDAEKDLTEVISVSSSIIQRSFTKLIKRGDGFVSIFNPLPWARRVIVKVPLEYGFIEGVDCQEQVDGGFYYASVNLNPLGVKTYSSRSGVCSSNGGVKIARKNGSIVLSNSIVELIVDNAGDLSSIRYLGREMLREPARLLIHVDKSGALDAWDVTDEFLRLSEKPETAGEPEVIIEGPLVSCIKVSKVYESSSIVQTICLEKDSPVISIHNQVKWRSKGVLVKHWFKSTLTDTKAYYGIPFGVIERPTGFETSWDKAKFEAPAVHFVDLYGGGLGLALISFSRHGYSTIRGDLSISILRSPMFPNPWSDVGDFNFEFYVYPHLGNYMDAEVPRVAHELYHAPYLFKSGEVVDFSLVRIDPPLTMLSTFKPSEERDGYVLRLYNPYHVDVTIRVNFGFKVKALKEVDITELRVYSDFNAGSDEVQLLFKPFEIKTIKILI